MPDVEPAKLIKLRELKGWNRAELSEQTGISRDAIAKIEHGVEQPTAEALDELCAVLGCSPAALLKEQSGGPA